MTRKLELDALRGLLLLLMALTHLPTRVSAYTSQPLGFVSAAEGFVFLSAFLAGSAYSSMLVERGVQHVRNKLWARTLKLYGYHLALLLFAFTIAAAFAAITGRPALRNLLTFYFDSPAVAIVSGPLLLYQPPLFDILPMYIVLLGLTPFLLETTAKQGWSRLLTLSVLVWVFSQVGGRRFLYESVIPLSGLHLPMEAAGSFDLFAWQFLWIAGLWAGTRHAQPSNQSRVPMAALLLAVPVAVVFFCWRHGIGGTWDSLALLYPLLDKWHLGILRLLNFVALAIIVTKTILPLFSWLGASVLSLLGRASLQAFCAHLVLCVASLGLIVDDETPLSSTEEVLVLALTLALMLIVAKRSGARDRQSA